MTVVGAVRKALPAGQSEQINLENLPPVRFCGTRRAALETPVFCIAFLKRSKAFAHFIYVGRNGFSEYF